MIFLQVSTTNVSNDRTLLQEAVGRGKQELVRILLEFGFVYFLIITIRTPCQILCFIFCHSVNLLSTVQMLRIILIMII